MKKLLFSLLIAVSTCINSQTKIQEVFLFAETSDSKFCNPASVSDAGCSGGYMYLTKSGNVIYEIMCTDMATRTYYIGTYVLSDNNLTCKFNKTYSSKPNAKIQNAKPWTLNLNKTTCETYPYNIKQSDRKSLGANINAMEKPTGIVYWKADEEKRKDIIEFTNETPGLSKL
jgi:hypothetical protein